MLSFYFVVVFAVSRSSLLELLGPAPLSLILSICLVLEYLFKIFLDSTFAGSGVYVYLISE